MISILPVIQIVIAIVLAIIILMQSANAELGGAFGGSGEVVKHTRRGFEKLLHRITIILAVLFIVVSITSFILGN
ncbi:preprotein translocase subunit SecG [Patescibacteria group bacterium]